MLMACAAWFVCCRSRSPQLFAPVRMEFEGVAEGKVVQLVKLHRPMLSASETTM